MERSGTPRVIIVVGLALALSLAGFVPASASGSGWSVSITGELDGDAKHPEYTAPSSDVYGCTYAVG